MVCISCLYISLNSNLVLELTCLKSNNYLRSSENTERRLGEPGLRICRIFFAVTELKSTSTNR